MPSEGVTEVLYMTILPCLEKSIAILARSYLTCTPHRASKLISGTSAFPTTSSPTLITRVSTSLALTPWCIFWLARLPGSYAYENSPSITQSS